MTHEIYTDGTPNPLLSAILNFLLIGLCECPVASVAWNPANKGANVTLSNGGLTLGATAIVGAPAAVSITSHNSGRRAFRAKPVFPGGPTDENVFVGLVVGEYNPASENWTDESHAGVILGADGCVSDLTNFAGGALSGLTFATGEDVRVLVDFDAGKVWFGNESATLGDPEAGTDAAYSFPPNTPLFILGTLLNADSTLTLDPGYADGSFLAW